MCWQSQKEYDQKRSYQPVDAVIFKDIGWRPLLKLSSAGRMTGGEKRKALKSFHEEYSYLCEKIWMENKKSLTKEALGQI
jgi:hypothetical protein